MTNLTPYTEADITRLKEWAEHFAKEQQFAGQCVLDAGMEEKAAPFIATAKNLRDLAALVEQLQKELEVDKWFQAMYAKRPYRWNFCRDEKGDYYVGRAAIGCDPILTFATINEAAKAAKDHHDASQAVASGEGK